jgi:hypothetical protein
MDSFDRPWLLALRGNISSEYCPGGVTLNKFQGDVNFAVLFACFSTNQIATSSCSRIWCVCRALLHLQMSPFLYEGRCCKRSDGLTLKLRRLEMRFISRIDCMKEGPLFDYLRPSRHLGQFSQIQYPDPIGCLRTRSIQHQQPTDTG